MTAIEQLAVDLLDQREWQLVKRLALILDDDAYDAGSLVAEMIPIYWERVGDRERTLFPDNIYRPLYYIHGWSTMRNFRDRTRAYVMVISGHLEGCLMYLTSSPPSQYGVPSQPFGRLVRPLKESGILSAELAEQLWKFNAAINVPSKHFGTYVPTHWLDERTFSVFEAACSLVLMRKLSMKLFEILKTNGVILPHGWPEFKDEWLSWSRMVNQNSE
jgi:hypothetical protein